jgi:hypothetical protein
MNPFEELLERVATEQGWSDESKLIHLLGFLQRVDKNSNELISHFEEYITDVAEEENSLNHLDS